MLILGTILGALLFDTQGYFSIYKALYLLPVGGFLVRFFRGPDLPMGTNRRSLWMAACVILCLAGQMTGTFIAWDRLSNVIQAQTCNAPVINSFTPNTGFIGSTVTITGANFDPIPANNQVFFGATQATIVSSSFGTIVVNVPTGANIAPIAVKNGCNKIGYSSVAFNGIFCPTPLTSQTYNNTAFQLNGIYGAYNMLAQDMDNDGKPDVISMRNGGGFTVARNNSTPGNLNFVAYNFAFAGTSVSTADFDGDGKRDINYPGYVARNISTGPGNINFQNTKYVKEKEKEKTRQSKTILKKANFE